MGDLSWDLLVLLLALDFSEAVLEEALRIGAPFVLSHHPFYKRPLSRIDLNDKGAAPEAQSLKEGISLYSAHTNLDVAPPWGSVTRCGTAGLRRCSLYYPWERMSWKAGRFCPRRIRGQGAMICRGGAGWTGTTATAPTRSCWGMGHLCPGEGTSPLSGRRAPLEKVSEYRLKQSSFADGSGPGCSVCSPPL